MILRVFPCQTSHTPDDAYAVVGPPSLFLPPGITEVHISVTFTWDRKTGLRLYRAWRQRLPDVPVLLGGPAVGNTAGQFVPGMYVRRGITYTSRGCDNSCPWCLVSMREGLWRPLPTIQPGYIVQDNNLLQGPKGHRRRVYAMLRRERRSVRFQGGLEARRFTPWDEARIRGLRLGQNSLWFACDSPGAMRPLTSVLERLGDLPIRFKRVFVLAGYRKDDSPEALEGRCREIAALGAIPFVQLYRGPCESRHRRWPDAWASVVRRWSRPALSLAHMKSIGLRPDGFDRESPCLFAAPSPPSSPGPSGSKGQA